MEEGRKSDSPRKRTRKRSYTTKDRTFMNTAEVRREIVNALHLHRQSPKPAIPCSSYRRQLTNSLPVPEPTWSTTAPAVLCAPVLEVEWFDNDNVSSSSSYSWWLEFLKSLDKKRDEITESSNVLDGRDAEISDSGVDDPNPFTDEWVVFPPESNAFD